MRKDKIKIFLVMFIFASVPLISDAREHDLYVDGSVSKSGDGSREKPFKTIKEAVEKGGDIFIENGKYVEYIELKKSTKLYGESENGVVISGEIVMKDKTKLQDITARGARTVITVKKNADAEIKNCTVKDFGKIGILAVAGGGKLKVSDSKIINGDGKGFYIEGGKTIELLNNEVSECNNEEGIDIRHKVKGVIRENLITNNGESGIELIVGSADLLIENNTIRRNGSSGIATQFYPDPGLNGLGRVDIRGNSIGENRKYGVDCNRPQGGSPGSSYWRDSIELEGNKIYANKMKSINDFCKLIDAVDEDEEVDNTIEDAGYEEETIEPENETEPEFTDEEKKRIETEKETERTLKELKLSEIELLLKKQESDMEIKNIIRDLEGRSKIKTFFIGEDVSKFENLLVVLKNKKQELEQVQILMGEIDLDIEEEMSIRASLDNYKGIINQHKEFANNKKGSFSLFGWVRNLF